MLATNMNEMEADLNSSRFPFLIAKKRLDEYAKSWYTKNAKQTKYTERRVYFLFIGIGLSLYA